MSRKNYRNKHVTAQDVILAKQFKKYLHMAGEHTLISGHGYVPVWSWDPKIEGVIEYESAWPECYVLHMNGDVSVRSIVHKIQSDRPVESFTWINKAGTEIKEDIACFSVPSLLRALSSMSMLVFPDESGNAVHIDANGTKYVLLKAEQLKLENNIGKVPCDVLLIQHMNKILETGLADYNIEEKLEIEHNIPLADIANFRDQALQLRQNGIEHGVSSEICNELFDRLTLEIKSYAYALKMKLRPLPSKQKPVLLPGKVIEEIKSYEEDPLLKIWQELKAKTDFIGNVDFRRSLPKEHPDREKVSQYISELRDIGFNNEQINKLAGESEWRYRFPNSKSTKHIELCNAFMKKVFPAFKVPEEPQ